MVMRASWLYEVHHSSINLTFRAVVAVDKKEQAEVYNIYLRKAAEIYGKRLKIF